MTKHKHKTSANLRGVGFLVLGMLIFSLQDIAVKWIGGNYPVLEIVTFRSVLALPLTLLLFRFEGGQGLPTTQRRKLQYVRMSGLGSVDSVLACVGEFGSVLVSAFRLTSGQVRPAPSLLGVQTATVVLWALKRPKHPGN